MRMLLVVAGSLLATGCSPALQENFNHAYRKDMDQLQTREWAAEFKKFFAVDEVYRSYALKEKEAERDVCFHPNSQRRVIRQEGVSDHMDYTWCVMAPPADNLGSRLDGRPDV